MHLVLSACWVEQEAAEWNNALLVVLLCCHLLVQQLPTPQSDTIKLMFPNYLNTHLNSGYSDFDKAIYQIFIILV